MGLKIVGTALTALSLTVSSVAVAQSAAPLSLAGSPGGSQFGADVGEASELRGPGLWIAGAVALGLIIWGLTELLDNDDEAFPNSP